MSSCINLVQTKKSHAYQNWVASAAFVQPRTGLEILKTVQIETLITTVSLVYNSLSAAIHLYMICLAYTSSAMIYDSIF